MYINHRNKNCIFCKIYKANNTIKMILNLDIYAI